MAFPGALSSFYNKSKKKAKDTNLPDEKAGKEVGRRVYGKPGETVPIKGGDDSDPRWIEHNQRLYDQMKKNKEREMDRRKLYDYGNLKPTKRTG